MSKSPIPVASHALAATVIDRCHELSRYSEVPGEITRTFLSPPMHGVHEVLQTWMTELGIQVRIDAMGNVRGLYPAFMPDAPRLVIGSHVDTVPSAGEYDGVLGVVLALGLIQALQGTRLSFEIEVIAFSEEEGIRFGAPFLGSRALIGDIGSSTLELTDRGGKKLREAIVDFGLSPENMPEAKLSGSEFAYLEFHIEQGPVLDERGLPLGIVELIAGQTRMELRLEGQAAHAGTTPMLSRRDAVAAAAEIISMIEQEALANPGLVTTVGRLDVHPGATNVIAGHVTMSVDVRHRDDTNRSESVANILDFSRQIAARRGIVLEASQTLDQRSVAMDASMVLAFEEACHSSGHSVMRMASGAGHDAMIMARRLPAAMLFLRSPGGISHHPAESVWEEDVAAALESGLLFLRRLSSERTPVENAGVQEG